MTTGRGRLLVASAALLWSTGGLFIKLVPLDALGVVFWRSVLTSAVLAAILRPARSAWRAASPLSMAVYAGMILTFVSATKLGTAANAIFLQYTAPFYVLLLSPLVLKEPLRRLDVAAIVVALAGMSLFFVGRLEAGALAGNLLGVASGVFFAGTVLLLRREAGGDGDPIVTVILGNLLAAAIAAPLASRLALDARGLLFAAYLGVVQMGLAYFLFVRGLATVTATEASLLGMLEPTFNPVWAFLGVGERPSAWALAGGAIVLSAVAARSVVAARVRSS